jgi:hypothetical protein
LEQQRHSEWFGETTTQVGDALIMGLLCLERDGLDGLRGSVLRPGGSGEVNHSGTELQCCEERYKSAANFR